MKKKQTLNEILFEGEELYKKIMENEGELTPELEDELHVNGNSLLDKIDSYGYILTELESDVKKYKDLADKFKKKSESRKKLVDNIKSRLKYTMESMGETNLKGSTFEISLSKPRQRVEIIDIEKLPVEYVKSELKPNKKLIMDEYKSSGKIPDGASIEFGESTIKIK